MAHSTALSLLLLGLFSISVQAAETAAQTDHASGFIIAPGWETVRNNCMACHSAKLVTQNSGSREHWLSLIRWMQDKQGLWPFDAKTEDTILTYLSSNYGAKVETRRPALLAEQLPENPLRKPKQSPSKAD
ncbi:hypothetical protein [Pseudomonas segetis]|uniref:Sulfite dehydrogenase (Cytochrome) subunit SorB n=1 Tax=Pseudomonas segetis TaxID=298908 RepID=A0A239FBF5_9PSED|nr:hypothetical protein [Pseudomonas segetis]SNS53643.1 sulfite dehydrogenase (cytochrome) subunit SorB [Pseudomonas segetis]